MDITSTILPIYDSLARQEPYRGIQHVSRVCPRHQLLPFLVKRTHSASNQRITHISLINCSGAETELLNPTTEFYYFLKSGYGSNDLLTSWTNNGFDTFTTSGTNITSAIETGSSGGARSNTFAVTAGDVVMVQFGLTLNSGTAPTMQLWAGSNKSNSVTLLAGTNIYYLQSTYTGNVLIDLTASVNCNFSIDTNYAQGAVWNTCNPRFYEFTSVDYFQYNGEILNKKLPLGTYYLKLYDGANYYYSEWFTIKDMYPNLITGWTNDSTDAYEALNVSADRIIYAINNTGLGVCNSNEISVKKGEKYILICNIILISSNLPNAYFRGNVAGPAQSLSNGFNIKEFTIFETSTTAKFAFVVDSASHFVVETVILAKLPIQYSKIFFTNSLDLGDILYQNGFTQQVYLHGYTHENDTEEIVEGDIKDAVLIPEKITNAPRYRIFDWVSPLLAQALKLLRQHTTVTVTDQANISYTANNVSVENSEESFDIIKTSVNFTANEKVWTINQSNIS